MARIIIDGNGKALVDNGNALSLSGVVRLPIDATRHKAYINDAGNWVSASDSYSIVVPVTIGESYQIRFLNSASGAVGTIFRYGFSTSNTISSQTLTQWVRTTPQAVPTATVTADRAYLIVQMSSSYALANINNRNIVIGIVV